MCRREQFQRMPRIWLYSLRLALASRTIGPKPAMNNTLMFPIVHVISYSYDESSLSDPGWVATLGLFRLAHLCRVTPKPPDCRGLCAPGSRYMEVVPKHPLVAVAIPLSRSGW